MKTTIFKIRVIENFKLKIIYAGLFFIATLFLPSSILAQEKEQDSVKITQEQLENYKELSICIVMWLENNKNVLIMKRAF